MVNFPSGLNNLQLKVDDLNADKLETVSADLKNISDVVSKKVVK